MENPKDEILEAKGHIFLIISTVKLKSGVNRSTTNTVAAAAKRQCVKRFLNIYPVPSQLLALIIRLSKLIKPKHVNYPILGKNL